MVDEAAETAAEIHDLAEEIETANAEITSHVGDIHARVQDTLDDIED